jgi:hypothetical protein
MLIPKSFRIRGVKHTVHIARTLKPKAYGRTNPAVGTIELATHYGYVQRGPIAMAETFWHEVVHCILFDMGDPRWKDETFVVSFSRRLADVVQTAELGGA